MKNAMKRRSAPKPPRQKLITSLQNVKPRSSFVRVRPSNVRGNSLMRLPSAQHDGRMPGCIATRTTSGVTLSES